MTRTASVPPSGPTARLLPSPRCRSRRGLRRSFVMHLIDHRRAEALIVPAGSVQGIPPTPLRGRGERRPIPDRRGTLLLSDHSGIRSGSPLREPAWFSGDSLAVFDTTYLQITRVASGEGTRFDLGPSGGILRSGLTVTLPASTERGSRDLHPRASHWSLAPRNTMEPGGTALGPPGEVDRRYPARAGYRAPRHSLLHLSRYARWDPRAIPLLRRPGGR
ncbi:MAG: hypothetical protein MZV64_16705 [Ignavibacteriales bacterium]|nr:hypothetical protein [Ignavibacteriales bacterium]